MSKPDREYWYGLPQQEVSFDDTLPSVKDVMDNVAIVAGLNVVESNGDSYFIPVAEQEQEQSASTEFGKAVSAGRPLLQQYRQRYADLSARLLRAQSAAALATHEGRERSQEQLKVFTNLEEKCAEFSRHLDDKAVGSSNQGSRRDAEGDSRKKAAEEANALAARYRSLLQHKGRMRSALQILSVSEQAAATVRTAAVRNRRGKGAEEALKSIEALRDLLRENFDRTDDPAIKSSRVAAELERVTRGRLEWLTHRLRVNFGAELADALREADPLGPEGGGWGGDSRGGAESGDGKPAGGKVGVAVGEGWDDEKQRRAVARVKAAIDRLFQLQFGRSSRRKHGVTGEVRPPVGGSRGSTPGQPADSDVLGNTGGTPAVTGMYKEGGKRRTEAEPAASWGGGAVWALDGLLEPVAVRFRFHFEEERPTNRTDRPEWFLSFLLRALEAYRPLLQGSQEGSASGDVDREAYFARGLALLARRRLRAQLGAAANDTSLLSHTVEEALSFDRQLDEEADYGQCPIRFPERTWPRCVEVFAQGEARFERWTESDAAAVEAKLADAVAAPGAWQAVDWKNGPPSSTPVTPSALAVCHIFWEVTERYRPLRDPLKQLRCARRVQEPLLRSYRNMLYWRGNDCRLNTVFRDDGSDSEGVTSTWAAALNAMLGSEKVEDTSPVGRWRSYCLAASSCAYVCAVLRDSEDDLLFAEMTEAAASAFASGATVKNQGPSSASLAAMGAAVGGVSRAVTSVANTAETATAGVVRAVGGGSQKTIIGPTHAISAALTTLKGASRVARRVVRHASYSGATTSTGDGVGTWVSDAESPENVSGGIIGVGSGDEKDGPINEVERDCGELDDYGNRSGALLPVGAAGEGGFLPDGLGSATHDLASEMVVDGGDVGGGGQGSVFGDEAGRYRLMLEAMMQGAVAACRDGFLWYTRSYLRSWDRGLAVIIPASSIAASSTASPAALMEASGKLATGLELLSTAMAVAEGALPRAQFREFWTTLASELDSAVLDQIVPRRHEMTQDEGLQLRADLKALMGPFSILARRRPEKHFPRLTEAALLLSLEKSQLRSLLSGLDAHGGGVEEARRGAGWDGWREEGGKLSPEGTQMRDMLENVGVRRLGPAEASLLLDKRLRGDRREHFTRLSAAAGELNPQRPRSRGGSGDNTVARDAGIAGSFPRPEGSDSGRGGLGAIEGGAGIGNRSREPVHPVG